MSTVLSHRTLALHQSERRGDATRVDEPKGYRRSCYSVTITLSNVGDMGYNLRGLAHRYD